MTKTNQYPYGQWPSSLSAIDIAAGSRRIRQVSTDGDYVYWLETLAHEQGRVALMSYHRAEGLKEALPSMFSIKTRVHEYGGGDYLAKDGQIVFADDKNQMWYVYDGLETHAITPIRQDKLERYADPTWFDNWLVLVRERHIESDVINELVLINLKQGGEPQIIAQGADFYMSPRFSDSGTKLCWLEWNHPNMPWDKTQLSVVDFNVANGAVSHLQTIGCDGAILEPRWYQEHLFCVFEYEGWWNLGQVVAQKLQVICPRHAEYSMPAWNFGYHSYTIINEQEIIAIEIEQAQERLVKLNYRTGVREVIDQQFASYNSTLYTYHDQLLLHASSSTEPATVVLLDTDNDVQILRSDAEVPLQPQDVAQALSFNCTGYATQTIQAFFYAPTNHQAQAPLGQKPPLLVLTHGGPTAHVTSALNLKIQYFTSRGFAVIDVNYSGSSGFGRAYRDRLLGQWGVADVFDCQACAQYAVQQGWVNPDALFIMGSSAGGYTTLAALAFGDTFTAGVSLYGVGDLGALVADTHKFEAHYTQRLIGEEDTTAQIYQQRSPIYHVEQLRAPMILLQGLEDNVVPVQQARAMTAALQQQGIKHELIEYEGEGHGFRQASTIEHSLTAIVSFLREQLC